MQKKSVFSGVWSVVTLAVVAGMSFFSFSSVLAVTSSSENYQLTETQFDSGTTGEGCSGNYCAQTTFGDSSLSVGKSSAAFDPKPEDTPALEVIIDPGQSNLGVLTTEHTATHTTTIRVRNNLSEGYIVQMLGAPPAFGKHVLHTPTTPTASSPGTELFGINVVANTTPLVGAAPAQIPGGQGVFGDAAVGYNTPNLFKYASGDVIARSAVSSGRTDYTVSMVVNISNTTPAGKYAADFSAIVIPTY